jgi:hypothetical protein
VVLLHALAVRPSGNYNLVVSGTFSISGPVSISQPFSYIVKSSTANLVEFDVSVSATTSGLSYTYARNYKYTK